MHVVLCCGKLTWWYGLFRQLDIVFDDADTVQEGTLFSIIGRKGDEGRQSILKEKVRCAGLTFDPSFVLHWLAMCVKLVCARNLMLCA